MTAPVSPRGDPPAAGPPADDLQGLAPVVPMPLFGVMPNVQRQGRTGFLPGAAYRLAIAEFDDQGRAFDRDAIEAIVAALDTAQDFVLVVFVHGWKHDARTDDDDLGAFRRLLDQTVTYERSHSSDPRPVLGVFVGWRGLSQFGPLGLTDLTFWQRQAAAGRVALGSVRELFGALRRYRDRRLAAGGNPLLVIAGHSFGGMIVYQALAQSLIEAASVPAPVMVPGFADLVLLINPAISGAAFLPIHDIVSSPSYADHRLAQAPVFVCVQADNDRPVGWFFPLGNAARAITQATRGSLERRCITHAIGFVDAFVNHRLTGPRGSAPFVLDEVVVPRFDPFWVVRATPDIIDGHGGIWSLPLRRFVLSLVWQQMLRSRSDVAPRSMTAAEMPYMSSPLAEFAREMVTRGLM